MVSDSDLVDRLREILSVSDLNTTTTTTVRRKLEEDFGIDLSEKKAFIREQIDLYLENQNQITPQDQEIAQAEEEEQDDDDVDEDEDEEASNNGEGSSKKRSKKNNKEVKKRGGGGGFTKLCNLSPQLQKFTGVPQLARTEVVKQLWSYIRENDLQDPSNRRDILCDETLRDLFEVDSINMFQMNKALKKHIWPLDCTEAPIDSEPKEKQRKHEREDSDEPKRNKKRQKGHKTGNSAFSVPVPLSDALVKFLGTGETALSRSEVIKRMWEYIKQNNLQDPSDKRRIISDEKLKELLDVDTFTGFTVTKLLTAHFIKAEQIYISLRNMDDMCLQEDKEKIDKHLYETFIK